MEQDTAALQEKLKNMSPEELAEYQKQNCIFCQIISGKVPSKKVYEDDKVFAILDINPASKGHMLVMPKEHYAIMPIIPPEVLGHMFNVSKKLSQAALKGLKATGTTIFIANGGIAGQRAQHFMLHIIPRYEADGLKQFDLKPMKIKDYEELRDKLRAKIGFKPSMTVKRDVIKEEPKKETKTPSNKKEVKTETVKETKEEPDKEYITSSTAKRYHNLKCAFAANIKEENRIYMTADEAELSGKKPCTCITGKKIPMNKDSDDDEVKSKKKKTKSTKNKAKKKDEEVIDEGMDKDTVDLDDIARLLG